MIPRGAFRHSIAAFFSPITELLSDAEVSEIMINGPCEIWVERKGKITLSSCSFSSKDALIAALTNVAQFAGRHFGEDRPILEAHLPDGSRIEAILPPLVEQGPVVAIRRFSKSTITIDRLIELDSITRQAAEFLKTAVSGKKNTVVSGGTGSGKTSMLNALSSFIGDDERVIVIEDTREVQLQQRHVVYLETRSADERGRGRVAIRDLLKATLRLRPDRIVVGEVRGGEALDLIQAMTSGHGGSMTTAHADSPMDALRRIETMAMMDDTGLPLSALRAQNASAVDLIVQVARGRDGARRVTQIASVKGLKADGDYELKNEFTRTDDGELVAAFAE